MDFDSSRLKVWFLNSRRDLPWRLDPSPYAVWVSEVMLQQTQVSVVIPYFLRWMQKYPTVQTLANAPLDDVIKEWEGLGYYSRARSLHEGAKMIVRDFAGVIPSTREELSQIKGLGPYTIGAVLSFAFHQRTSAVDGNVLRVLSRYFHIEDDIAKAKTQAKMRELADQILPKKESWIVNEALIELGATICSRKPKCLECPLKNTCKAFASQSTERLPVKTKAVKTEKLYRSVAVIMADNHVLIRRGLAGEIMNDLHEFPYLETDEHGLTISKFKQLLTKQWGLSLTLKHELELVNQSFTRYRVYLNPVSFHCKERIPIDGYSWHPLAQLHQLAFSSGHRRVLQQLSDALSGVS